MSTNGHFGHSGHSEVSENGPSGFPPKNLGIDTKIKSLRCSDLFQIWPFYLINTDQKCPQMGILATQVNLGCLKMVPMDFPCPKPGHRNQNQVSKMFRTQVAI